MDISSLMSTVPPATVRGVPARADGGAPPPEGQGDDFVVELAGLEAAAAQGEMPWTPAPVPEGAKSAAGPNTTPVKAGPVGSATVAVTPLAAELKAPARAVTAQPLPLPKGSLQEAALSAGRKTGKDAAVAAVIAPGASPALKNPGRTGPAAGGEAAAAGSPKWIDSGVGANAANAANAANVAKASMAAGTADLMALGLSEPVVIEGGSQSGRATAEGVAGGASAGLTGAEFLHALEGARGGGSGAAGGGAGGGTGGEGASGNEAWGSQARVAERSAVKQKAATDAASADALSASRLGKPMSVEKLKAAKYQPAGIGAVSAGPMMARQPEAPPRLDVTGHVVTGSMAKNRLSHESLINVQNAVHTLRQSGGGEIKIRLKPESLGEMSIRVSTAGRNVGLKVQASSGEAVRILEESINDLRDKLATQNLSLGKVDLSVASPSGSRDAAHGGVDQGPSGGWHGAQARSEAGAGGPSGDGRRDGGDARQESHTSPQLRSPGMNPIAVGSARHAAGSGRLDVVA